ncbi:MAG TPA: hypothetical protein PK201_08310, partial [Accumulibacter sp.]|nr:hypothetical protein [Accumulibacter sp.]
GSRPLATADRSMMPENTGPDEVFRATMSAMLQRGERWISDYSHRPDARVNGTKGKKWTHKATPHFHLTPPSR